MEETKEVWRWEYDSLYKSISLRSSRRGMIMDFKRWGMEGATPRFPDDNGEMQPFVRPCDKKEWVISLPRGANTIDHPIANRIASVPALESKVEELESKTVALAKLLKRALPLVKSRIKDGLAVAALVKEIEEWVIADEQS